MRCLGQNSGREIKGAAAIGDNALILFMGDNGGATYTRATDNAPLRGGNALILKGLVGSLFYEAPHCDTWFTGV